ncbi:hypothetical protein [Streptomyces scopuliridis]|uniref:hypothetical protein n=1 Tax=Streptomyces scopuliridis TaxID=452529 RepID=UPI00367422AB
MPPVITAGAAGVSRGDDVSDDHSAPRATGRIRSDIAHNARVWNYRLGGHFL